MPQQQGAVAWTLVAAADRNGAIGITADGRGLRLPWHLPEDLAYFKRTTLGRAVVMGRRTFESIGRALPGRLNVVLTRRGDLAVPPGVVVAADAAAAETAVLEAAGPAAPRPVEACVIGGAEVFEQFLPLAKRIHLTEIDRAFDEADCRVAAFAPGRLAQAGWREASREAHWSAQGFGYAFVVYEKSSTTAKETG